MKPLTKQQLTERLLRAENQLDVLAHQQVPKLERELRTMTAPRRQTRTLKPRKRQRA